MPPSPRTRAPGRFLARVQAGFEVGALIRRGLTPAGTYGAEVQARLRRRDDAFLWMVTRLIFGNPRSPYLPLLSMAGYNQQRIADLVGRVGVEETLQTLQRAGVYLTVPEFKGKIPVERRGRTFRIDEASFINPMLTGAIESTTSGSRYRPLRTVVSVEHLRAVAPYRHWIETQWGLTDRPLILLQTPGSGLINMFLYSMVGRVPLRWISPLPGQPSGDRVTWLAARLGSRRGLPAPEPLPPGGYAQLAAWVRSVAETQGVEVRTFANPGLRLVLAAADAGIPMGDVAFLLGGEPVTPTKRAKMELEGYKVFSQFAFNELGWAAVACPRGVESDDLHVLSDAVAIVRYERPVAGGQQVPAYLFTTLDPTARRVFLNVESGDYGGLERRTCGCPFGQIGLDLHMHSIRSFEKLTAEGVVFLGDELVRLVEEILPQRFGGGPSSYQLVEEEDTRGVTRLFLVVGPDVGVVDERDVSAAAYEHLVLLHGSPAYGRFIRRLWERSDTLQVIRRQPYTTSTGKVLHLHSVPDQARRP